MPRAKQYVALENVLKAAVNAEIAHRATEKEQGNNKNADEAQKEALGELLAMKKSGLLGYKKMLEGNIVGHFQSSTAKVLWPEVEQKATTFMKEFNLKKPSNWWNERMVHALPQKAKMTGGKRKIGEMTAYGAISAEGSAIETAARLEGLLQDFDGGMLTPLMQAMTAITSGNEGFNNKCYVFSDEEKEAIALAKCKERNNLVAMIQDDGKEVDKFIKAFGTTEGLAILEEQARKHAKEKAHGRGIDENTIYAAGGLTFVSGAKLIADYLNIKKALNHHKVSAAKDKKGSWRVLVCGEKKMKKHDCVGTTIQNDREYYEYERALEGWQYTHVELWTTSEKPLVIDSDAKVDPSRSDDPRHKKIKLADTERYVRAVCITEDVTKPMTTFKCVVGENNVKHHRLAAIYEHHYGWGFSQTPLIMEYLGLKDGESFEDHQRFKYGQDLSDKAIRARLRREKYLDTRKWDKRKLAKWTDVDHLLGRSKMWKNSNFFCMHVSHSWNRAMAYVRICYGDWLDGFANIKYHSGSD
eukprot:scaffold24132_cov151-Skeletonema_dohrnii-CCMP3373.AAC.1